jgi:trehalose 6-phosphate phosphatase
MMNSQDSTTLTRYALFLDVDGTLLDIARTPEAVEVSEELKKILNSLKTTLGGALALVSGRSIADLDRLFAPLMLCIAGVHGSERRTATGTILRTPADAQHLDRARKVLDEFAGSHQGVLIEDKNIAIAVHYREAPQWQAEVERIVSDVQATLGGEFRIQKGKCVCELRPARHSKASAIASYVAEAPFAGRTPIFIGDDVTDEDGFEFVNSIGMSIKVGPGATQAKYRIASVQDVHRFLHAFPQSVRTLSQVRT